MAGAMQSAPGSRVIDSFIKVAGSRAGLPRQPDCAFDTGIVGLDRHSEARLARRASDFISDLI